MFLLEHVGVDLDAFINEGCDKAIWQYKLENLMYMQPYIFTEAGS